MFKSLMHKFIALMILTTFTLPMFAGDYQVEDQPKVMEVVMQMPQKGILKQKDNGYLYVEVARDFIAETLPLIDLIGKIVPPQHFKSRKGIGAHISVMYENERISNEIWDIPELGQEITFTPMELRTVKLMNNNKMRKLWLIAVAAPELEKLRENYGLQPKLKDHDFHITLGTQMPNNPQICMKKIKEPEDVKDVEGTEEVAASQEAA